MCALRKLSQRVSKPVVKASLLDPLSIEWCDIPAGKVTLEGGYYELMEHYYNSHPIGTYAVPAFAIAKYPVTNAQFQVFVDTHDGYANAAWWDYSRTAADWREENQEPTEPDYA